jgi:uncharacterized protein (DUF302 family)
VIFTYRTTLSCKEIETRIEEDAKVFGLMMKKHYPFSKNLPDNGFDIKEYASVFELCKPSTAAELLNTQPELNILMPCRISVFEKDGISYVSTPDLKMQLEVLDCEAGLKEEILDLYDKIITMIKGW